MTIEEREHERGVSFCFVYRVALRVGGGLHVPLKPLHSIKAIHYSKLESSK